MAKKRKKSLNIAHLHWGFPPIIGGVETHLTVILPAFAAMGHNASLLTGTAEGSDIEEDYKGVKIRRAPIMDLNWLVKRGLHGITNEVRDVVVDFVDEMKPDVLHAHNMHYFSKAHTKILEEISLKKGIPLVLTAHNAWDDTLFLDLSTEIKWTHIIAVSHFIERELRSVGCSHKNVTTIHHGVDEKAFHPRFRPEKILRKYPQLKGKKIFFHPARMGLAKGCDVSIKALRILREKYPDVMLVLAGTKNIVDWGLTQQKDIAYMVQLVDKFDLRDNILIDSYALKDMPYLYAASQVCIYPSTAFEPFGLTMLEAMASARPMIVSNMGGMPEIIREDINGFIIPPKSSEVLASRVAQLFDDGNLREMMGATGRRMVEKDYTRRAVASATLDIYKKYL
jgi:glycosyltransferase involved in cell wall biosynthesis